MTVDKLNELYRLLNEWSYELGWNKESREFTRLLRFLSYVETKLSKMKATELYNAEDCKNNSSEQDPDQQV